MANCFGEVVDDYKLELMPRYAGRRKTQEDRAREARNLVSGSGKNERACRYVEGVKAWYGNGQSTLCLVYNATGAALRYVADHDWYGYLCRTPYPAEIGNGQWAAFHHVHRTSAASGSEAAVVYRGRTTDGEDRDILVAWSTPWNPLYRNKAYCEIGVVDSFQGRWDDIEAKANNSGYSCAANSDGFKIHVSTATGDSPKFTAMIEIQNPS